jgi:ankyrin repeat protein
MYNFISTHAALLCVLLSIIVSTTLSVANESKQDQMLDELCTAVRADILDDVKRILDAHPSLLDLRCSGGQTPIMAATLAGSAKVAKRLLEIGADTSIGEDMGYTPFHGAGFQGRAEIGQMLLDHGLSPIDMHSDGYTPLHRAAWGSEKRHTEFVKFLLKNGVDPNIQSRSGQTPFQMTNNRNTKNVLLKYIEASKNDDSKQHQEL